VVMCQLIYYQARYMTIDMVTLGKGDLDLE